MIWKSLEEGFSDPVLPGTSLSEHIFSNCLPYLPSLVMSYLQKFATGRAVSLSLLWTCFSSLSGRIFPPGPQTWELTTWLSFLLLRSLLVQITPPSPPWVDLYVPESFAASMTGMLFYYFLHIHFLCVCSSARVNSGWQEGQHVLRQHRPACEWHDI